MLHIQSEKDPRYLIGIAKALYEWEDVADKDKRTIISYYLYIYPNNQRLVSFGAEGYIPESTPNGTLITPEMWANHLGPKSSVYLNKIDPWLRGAKVNFEIIPCGGIRGFFKRLFL